MPVERHRMRLVAHTIDADASRVGEALEGARIEDVSYIDGETELLLTLRKGKRTWILGLQPEGEDGGPGWVEMAGPWRDGEAEDEEGPYPLHQH